MQLDHGAAFRVVPPNEHARLKEALARFTASLSGDSETIRSIRYVSGRHRAFVFEITADSPVGTRSYFLKFGVRADEEITTYVNNEAARTYRVHESMSGSDTFRVTEPAARYDDLACFVLRGSRGERLDSLIRRAATNPRKRADFDRAVRYCTLAAQWLPYFQDRVRLGSGNTVTSSDELLARAERELVVFSLSAPGRLSEADCRSIRGKFYALLEEFQPQDLIVSARHNDFAPWNILCFDGAVCVIDYADLTEGCRYFDAYQFVDAMHVLSRKMFVRRATVLQLNSFFVRECEVIAEATSAASRYFKLLFKLIRTNAVVNNSSEGLLYALRNRGLIKRYLHELAADTRAPVIDIDGWRADS